MAYIDIPKQGITSLREYFKENPCILGYAEIDCSGNLLTSLDGCPKGVTRLDCSNNKLTSLAGCPKSVKYLWCGGNLLENLKGCPKSLEILNCCDNKLKTLKGGPKSVREFDCSKNKLQSLYGCPAKVRELDCSFNQLVSLADFQPDSDISDDSDFLGDIDGNNFKKWPKNFDELEIYNQSIKLSSMARSFKFTLGQCMRII